MLTYALRGVLVNLCYSLVNVETMVSTFYSCDDGRRQHVDAQYRV